MTQIATVERIIDGDHAVVSVPRKSACGHDCEECAGCGVSGAAVRAKALNTVGARVGQKVVVQSDTKKMLRIVALASYISPKYNLCCFGNDSFRMAFSNAENPPNCFNTLYEYFVNAFFSESSIESLETGNPLIKHSFTILCNVSKLNLFTNADVKIDLLTIAYLPPFLCSIIIIML